MCEFIIAHLYYHENIIYDDIMQYGVWYNQSMGCFEGNKRHGFCYMQSNGPTNDRQGTEGSLVHWSKCSGMAQSYQSN